MHTFFSPEKFHRYQPLLCLLRILPAAGIALNLLAPVPAGAGTYLNSAHGDTTDGVSRTSFLSHARGNCAHCHEQHASFDGIEPAPTGGTPSEYLLLTDNYTNQTTDACFICHVDVGSLQSGGLANYSYSRRAGGWAADTQNDIKEAFAYSSPDSAHNLGNIVTFITGKWGYTASSNPCAACHDPHAAQGDPQGSSAAKSSGARGYPVSRPSQHSSTPWPLWGDDYTAPGAGNGERMNNYTSAYQAPYRFGSTVTFEPDGSATEDGSNLTDFNTFCTDCHNATNVIYSTNLGRNLKTIDWDTEKHGKGNADASLCGDAPYPSGAAGLGKVLACTDCHEPHGSPNVFLLRNEVNGAVLNGSIDSYSVPEMHYLCQRCHLDDLIMNPTCDDNKYYIIHHSNSGCSTDPPYVDASCNNAGCHTTGASTGCGASRNKKICTDCHFHGSSVTNCNNTAPATRLTF